MSLPKVALFLPSLNGGGAERVFINLARHFHTAGLEPQLVVGINEGAYKGMVPSVDVVDLGSAKMSRAILPLTAYLKRARPDILLSAMPHANLVALVAAKLAGGHTKVIVTSHEDVLQRWRTGNWKDRAVLALTKWAYRWAEALVAVSHGALRSEAVFLGSGLPCLSRAIFNPILDDEDDVHPLRRPQVNKDEPYVIVAAGRLEFEKDFATLLKAVSLLQSKRLCHLFLFGEGSQRHKLEESCRSLGIHECVSMPGFTHELKTKLLNADVLVMSSLWEGFGNVLVEALACGCPVVSTDCPGGPREILGQGRYGLLAPVGDPQALADQIESVLSGNGAQFDNALAVAPYRASRIVSQYQDIINECLMRT